MKPKAQETYGRPIAITHVYITRTRTHTREYDGFRRIGKSLVYNTSACRFIFYLFLFSRCLLVHSEEFNNRKGASASAYYDFLPTVTNTRSHAYYPACARARDDSLFVFALSFFFVSCAQNCAQQVFSFFLSCALFSLFLCHFNTTLFLLLLRACHRFSAVYNYIIFIFTGQVRMQKHGLARLGTRSFSVKLSLDSFGGFSANVYEGIRRG